MVQAKYDLRTELLRTIVKECQCLSFVVKEALYQVFTGPTLVVLFAKVPPLPQFCCYGSDLQLFSWP